MLKVNSTTLLPTNFDLHGHRGCRGLMPENTIPALLKAIDLNVTTLEMDVVITKDKQVILSHEPFFSHEITIKPGGNFLSELEETTHNIYNMPYNEVIKYDVGMKVHPRFQKQQKIPVVKPLLADVIDQCEAYLKKRKRRAIYYNIETKSTPSTDNVFHPEPAEFVELLMAVVNEKNVVRRVIIQSFDVRTLQYLHQHHLSVKTALLVEDSTSLDEHITALGFTPTIFSPEYHLVNKSLVAQCKANGIKIIPWTVNNNRDMKKMIAIGVDGFITDYP